MSPKAGPQGEQEIRIQVVAWLRSVAHAIRALASNIWVRLAAFVAGIFAYLRLAYHWATAVNDTLTFREFLWQEWDWLVSLGASPYFPWVIAVFILGLFSVGVWQTVKAERETTSKINAKLKEHYEPIKSELEGLLTSYKESHDELIALVLFNDLSSEIDDLIHRFNRSRDSVTSQAKTLDRGYGEEDNISDMEGHSIDALFRNVHERLHGRAERLGIAIDKVESANNPSPVEINRLGTDEVVQAIKNPHIRAHLQEALARFRKTLSLLEQRKAGLAEQVSKIEDRQRHKLSEKK